MLLCLALAGAWLAACASQAAGPRAWIDRPLDGQTLPLGPVTLQAHAADADGLRAIEFRLDGEPIGEVAVDAVRFGEASLEWQPPAPGTYLLEVVALDTGGRRGAAARVTLVVADGSLLSLPTPTAPPDVVITGVTCGPAYSVRVDFEVAGSLAVERIELFSTHATAAGSRLVFQAPYPSSVNDSLWLDEASADEIDRPHQVRLEVYYPNLEFPALAYAYEPGPAQRCPGHYAGEQVLAATPGLQALWIARLNTNCRLGPGTAFDSQDVIESGAQAPIDGQNAEGTWFRVQPPGSSRTCWVSTASGTVQGDLSDVPVISVARPATQTPAVDLPPSIGDFTAAPGLILTEGTGCSSYSRTVTLGAVVDDDIGVASVVAQWTLGTLSGETTLVPAGGNTYSGSIGPVTQAGTMSIHLIARDTSGASAQSGPRTVTVQNCIE
jgi:hypothetical protein